LDLKALLIFALMWSKEKEGFLEKAESIIQNDFGEIIEQTEEYTTEYSKYYQKEMGKNLRKKFIVINKVIKKDRLIQLKKYSQNLEKYLSISDNRTVNIDPLYLDLDQVVVATSKYRGNRIYLGEGVFAELELWYHHRSFQPFLWTYLDYKEKIPFFNEIRKLFSKKSKEIS
jgi:hypothetical protein